MPTLPLPLPLQSATALARQIRSGALGARELLELYLDRVDRLNPALNAVIWQDRARARARADAADAARARGERCGPLCGVPMTVKESYDLVGAPTTWGLPALAGHRASEDALAVQRLEAAGAVVFGKTNVPVQLADFQSYNPVYGTTENPWAAGRTPGGSSGGSAAALAAGLTALEIGSDIGGSIRNPAHFCGVFGHKPTWGLVPPRGHTIGGALTPPDIAVVGPLARSAADLETMLRAMAGPDAFDPPLTAALPALTTPPPAWRVAVWDDDPGCPVSAAVRARVQAVAAALAEAGATVDHAARPDFPPAHSHRVYAQMLAVVMSAGLDDDEFAQRQAQAAGLHADDDSDTARQLRWQTMPARSWHRLNEARTWLRWAWHRFFEHWDVLVTPIMPTTAYPHDHRPFGQRSIAVDGTDHPYFGQTFWSGLAGIAQLPATVVPAGPGPDGLPIGVQLIGPAWSDFRLLGIAQRLESMGFAFRPPPGV